MENNYYGTIGKILRESLEDDKDPFNGFENYCKHSTYIKSNVESSIEENTTLKRVPVPSELVEDFAVLNVLPGMPLSECKKAWKLLLKKYHPDVASNSNGNTETIIHRINNSYKKIETWYNIEHNN